MSLMRIEDLFHFEKGILQSSKCTEGEFDFITASSEWKTHNEYTHDCEALVFAAAASGSLGRTHYVNGKFISSDLCFIITPKDPINFPIDLKFYHMIFNEFKNDIVKNTKAGTSKEAIGMKAFGNYKLPYFDIAKQIETKIQFVNMQQSKVELNSELTHQLDLIKQLRQAFLREAMQGKLVKSTNTKETGQQLLEKIKAEKAQLIAEKKLKKEKELPPIPNEEIPFEIPEHWAWCRLGEICGFITKGTTPSLEKIKSDEKIPYIKVYNIVKQKINFNFKPQYIDEDTHQNILGRSIVYPKDVLMNIVGPPLCKVAIVPDTYPQWNINQALAIFRPLEIKINVFLYFYLCEGSQIQKLVPLGVVGQDNLSLEQCRNLIFPLPPLHEQEQIVTKLEELMAFCDGLEQSIKESQGYNEKLLQQVLREALQSKEEFIN